MNAKQKSNIAWDYWSFIAIAVWVIVADGAFDGNTAMEPSTYFIALALIIHAHGNRTRATLLALHAPADAEK